MGSRLSFHGIMQYMLALSWYFDVFHYFFFIFLVDHFLDYCFCLNGTIISSTFIRVLRWHRFNILLVIDLESAVALWSLLLPGKFALLELWLEFIQVCVITIILSSYDFISTHIWGCVLIFPTIYRCNSEWWYLYACFRWLLYTFR